MKKHIIMAVVFTALTLPGVQAKRVAPTKAVPVSSGNVEYRAPLSRSQMGFIEAWDTKKNKLLWRRQIYVVNYDTNLETDVQDVFIKTMKLDENTLIITNERNSQYQLDLKTLEVKVLKGSLIESRR